MDKIWSISPVRLVRKVAQVYFQQHVSRSAAELAYFMILTFFPLLICIHAFVGTLQLDAEMVLGAAASIIPRESLGILRGYMEYVNSNQSSALLVAGLSMTLLSASAAMRGLINVMDDIYGHDRYSAFRRLLSSFVFSVLLLAVVYLSIVILVTGGWFFQMLRQVSGISNPLAHWHWVRFILLFGLVLLFVLLLYRMSSPRGRRRPSILTGAVLSAGSIVVCSILFSWFIGLSSRYSLVYGSLASVVILLVWLYLCGNILILGSVVNSVLYRHKKSSET